MKNSLLPRISYITIVLLLLSIFADMLAYFSGRAFLETIAFLAMVGCLMSCGISLVASIHGMRRRDFKIRQRQNQDIISVRLALTLMVLALTIWRWATGNVVVSSFDGGYPVLLALALLIACYALPPSREID
jgi:uncharacterized membrane protein